MRLVKPVMKKPLRQQNRQIISYVPRTEPAPPEHAIKMDSFRDVWMLRGKYVAFVLMGESFLALTGVYCANPPSVGQIRFVRKMRSKNKKAPVGMTGV